jgi:hypothetical protein
LVAAKDNAILEGWRILDIDPNSGLIGLSSG